VTPLPLTRDLVLIGGGHTHALVLRMWAMDPLAGVRLTLINPDPVAPYTGMLPGYYMESNGNRFVKNGANGVTPVVDGDMVAMPTGAGAGNEVVNITANTNMGSFETSIFALRGGAFTLNSPTGASNDATITLTGSGADVGGVASFGAFAINPNLKFGSSGTNEALFYTGSTLTVNGNITAGSITKFGTGGTLVISNDQSDAARGLGAHEQNKRAGTHAGDLSQRRDWPTTTQPRANHLKSISEVPNFR
jgi:hypothetical protein